MTETRLAVLESKAERTEKDVQTLSTQVAILSERLDRGFAALSDKLEKTNGEWLRSFNVHIAADAEADKTIIEKTASIQSWIRGAVIGLGVILPLLSWLVDSGLLEHGK
jgi:uncharacterized coiled-coil protein SlyX